jgi:hypothetical protein
MNKINIKNLQQAIYDNNKNKKNLFNLRNYTNMNNNQIKKILSSTSNTKLLYNNSINKR